MATVHVRYIVRDVNAAIAFYVPMLGFREIMHSGPTFAMLTRRGLRLVLSAPNPSAVEGSQCPMVRRQEPGAWNRFASDGDDLESMEQLRKAGARFRNDIVVGVG